MATRKSLAIIERALLQIPEQCRYHGDQIDRGTESWVGRSCCDTGFPSLLRREALAQLAELDAQPPLTVMADRLERENPDRDADFSAGVDWAIDTIRAAAKGA